MNISKIETYLNGIIDNVVSDNTFFGSTPDKVTIDKAWTDMVFIEIPNGIADHNSYGKGTILVWLYAKPLSSGRKNVAKMSQLETKLNEVIANGSNSSYTLNRRNTFTDYDNSINWHCNAVEVIIKVL